jgi:hypothetical protein
MFEPGKILLFGGPTNRSIIIDMSTGDRPRVTPSGSLAGNRFWVNGTLLPDGRVLATGGSTKDSTAVFFDPIDTYGSALAAEVWDPATGVWTPVASAANPRLYHSTALLLPDGRVLTAGGGAPGPADYLDAELYEPDYLVRADGGPTERPRIASMSTTEATAGERITLSVEAGTEVGRVTLTKTGSVTHSFNMEQRFNELAFSAAAPPDGTSGDGVEVTVQLPFNDAELTPGFHLLTVIDRAGIPSESRILRVLPPAPDRLRTGVDGQVARLYQAYFLRPPDDGGYRYWRRLRLNGVSAAEVSEAFAASREFQMRYGSLDNGRFVDQVYRNVLGRAAEPEGRTYWIGQLEAGLGRGTLMLAFSESAEFITRTGTADLLLAPLAAPDESPAAPVTPPPPTTDAPEAPGDPVAAQVRRLYLGYFLREPEPDGLAYWVAIRASGRSLDEVSNQFAMSQEFINRYGAADDPTFVDLVYVNVLGRPAEPEGRAYWIGRLDTGLGRGSMMAAFTESTEHVRRVG